MVWERLCSVDSVALTCTLPGTLPCEEGQSPRSDLELELEMEWEKGVGAGCGPPPLPQGQSAGLRATPRSDEAGLGCEAVPDSL